MRADGDAPKDLALGAVFVIADVDQVPVPFIRVAEHKEGVRMVFQQLVDGQTFCCERQREATPLVRGRQPGIEHVKGAKL